MHGGCVNYKIKDEGEILSPAREPDAGIVSFRTQRQSISKRSEINKSYNRSDGQSNKYFFGVFLFFNQVNQNKNGKHEPRQIMIQEHNPLDAYKRQKV